MCTPSNWSAESRLLDGSRVGVLGRCPESGVH
jgi:hypothetical protein